MASAKGSFHFTKRLKISENGMPNVSAMLTILKAIARPLRHYKTDLLSVIFAEHNIMFIGRNLFTS